jgi:membrane protein YdbS with pleckstrin-like domain
MLTDEEKEFINYWNSNRLRKKKVWKQLAVGLPLATALVLSIFINIIFRWHKEAEKVFKREQASLVIVLVVACLLIVIFIVILSARHRWDINEQHYKELLAKKG